MAGRGRGDCAARRAQAAGVRAASISSYEGGKLVPSHRMVVRLLDALGLPYAALDLVLRLLADLRKLAEAEERPDETAGDLMGGGGDTLKREIEMLAIDAGRVERRAVSLFFQLLAGRPLE